MNSTISYLIEASACLVLFYAVYHFMLRKEACFQYNRLYLLASSIMALVIPAVSFRLQVPGNDAILFTQVLREVVAGGAAGTAKGGVYWWWLALGSIYLTGMVVVGWRFGANLWQLRQLIRQGNRHQPKGKPFVMVHLPAHKRMAAFSFMNYLFVNQQQATADHTIVYHEEVHIREKHSVDVLWFELLTVIFWFNPVLWLYRKAIALTHEFIADRATMQQTGTKQYASLLARHTLQHMQLPLAHHFGHAPVMQRLKMISFNKKPTPMLKFIAPIFFIVAALFAFGCETTTTGDDTLQDIEQASGQDVNAIKEKMNNEGPDEHGVYSVVDQTPKPEGDFEALFSYIINNLEYPEQARKIGVEGKVFVQFVIDKNGNMTDVQAVKGIGAGCDQAAVNAVANSNLNWTPGAHEGKNVSVRMVLPVSFKLDD